ncbi:hypothetical protein JST99_02655 [Candidatus Dependentiae bacterium]|nr:hypothetical protein [Candidatus Dependentiae bacterium]MCC7415183.1 hypothetical protein [Campylobacterota bacterium]
MNIKQRGIDLCLHRWQLVIGKQNRLHYPVWQVSRQQLLHRPNLAVREKKDKVSAAASSAKALFNKRFGSDSKPK